MNQEHELVSYFKALGKEMGYPAKELSKRLNISQATLYRKYEDPKEFTVREVDKICQILQPDESHELRLRGYTR